MPPALPALFARTVAAHGLLDAAHGYLVALSGGADSVALLLLMHEAGYRIEAAHCHFGLRGEESDRDARFAADLCRRLGVRLHTVRFDTRAEARSHGESIEMAARRLRYAWFDDLLRRHDLSAVCVAHHMDDDVETMLLNLVRGTGIHGLTGMAYARPGVVRPLLDATRADILAYLAARGQDYVTDSSNADTAYKRNLVRHRVLPLLETLNPAVRRTLRADMRRLAHAAAAYDREQATLLTAHAERLPHGWAFGAATLATGSLRDALATRFGFTAADVAAMHPLASLGPRACFQAPEWQAAPYRGRLEVVRRPTAFAPVPLPLDALRQCAEAGGTYETQIALPDGMTLTLTLMDRQDLAAIPRGTDSVALDADRTGAAPEYRRVAPGERFAPYGAQGTRLVSDYLTDRHVSRLEREWQTVVADGDDLLWLVGQRAARRAAITEATTRVWLLRMAPTPGGGDATSGL